MPLTLFLILGCMAFAIYGWTSLPLKPVVKDGGNIVIVVAGVIVALTQTFPEVLR